MINDDLSQLALKLTLNAVNISAGEYVDLNQTPAREISRSKAEVYKKVLSKNALDDIGDPGELYRCIVVVGAGASYNACHHHELGRSFAASLRTKYGERSRKVPGSDEPGDNLIEHELDRLKRIYKLDPDEFETVLYAISKYYPIPLLKDLKIRYGHRYNPSIPYELLAHLMKHRFADAVINFNFDEMLDQSIEDELKPDEYHSILYDGDAKLDDIFIQDEGLRYPLYIKPHGTISHESSLRFTEEAYYGMPQNMENILKELIEAKIKIGNHVKQMKVVLVAIGFNMQSTEFNVLVNKYLPAGSEIYFIKANPGVPPIDPRPLDLNSWNRPALEARAEVKVIPVGPLDLNEIMTTLWNHILSNFNEDFPPRDILRHLLICKLFSKTDAPRTDQEIKEYLWQRTYVEFTLSVAKYKGFICANQLAEDRFGKYFSLALQKGVKGFPADLLSLIYEFDFTDYSYGAKAFTPKSRQAASAAIMALTTTNDLLRSEIFARLGSLLDAKKIRMERLDENRETFNQTFKQLMEGTDTEISPKFSNVYGQVFNKPKIIKTKLGLDLKTMQYFENDDWDLLYAAAETGEWLYNILAKNVLKNPAGTEINLIYADQSIFIDKLKDITDSQKITFEKKQLPWWLHNQHLTIFCRREQERITVLRAVYFTRRLRASYINPILLEDHAQDLRVLVEIYEAYYKKAVQYEKVPGLVIGKDDIGDEMKKYDFPVT